MSSFPNVCDEGIATHTRRRVCSPTRLGDNITDGDYDAMMNAIRRDELPSMYFMQYEIVSPSPPRSGGEGRGEVVQLKSPLPAQSRGEGMFRVVRNLLLVPHFAFPPSAIIKRKPLSPSARRAGWVAFFHPQTCHKAIKGQKSPPWRSELYIKIAK